MKTFETRSQKTGLSSLRTLHSAPGAVPSLMVSHSAGCPLRPPTHENDLSRNSAGAVSSTLYNRSSCWINSTRLKTQVKRRRKLRSHATKGSSVQRYPQSRSHPPPPSRLTNTLLVGPKKHVNAAGLAIELAQEASYEDLRGLHALQHISCLTASAVLHLATKAIYPRSAC